MDMHSNGGKQMIRTVEKGKTLLIDGPASVTVTSGKVEAFGYSSSSTNRIVVREGKRLPLAVEEKATFDISLAEKATAEEVDGNTIPASWSKSYEEVMSLQAKPIVVMVLGTVDSGKTSFCTYLTNKLLGQKKKVAVLDGDLGQSDIGPPCTVAYTIVARPITDLFNLQAKNAIFIGVTSPSGMVDKVIEALASLKKEIFTHSPDFIVINTDGWTEGEEAIKYKVRLVEEISPDIVFIIQQKDELTPLINALEKFTKLAVESPLAIGQRSMEKRKNLRELGYQKYLRNAKIQSFPQGWLKIEDNELFGLNQMHPNTREAGRIYDLLGMKPLHFAERGDRISIIIGKRRWINTENLKKVEEATKKKVIVIRKGEEEGLLTALYNDEGRFLGIGVLQEIEYLRKTIKILTPVSKKIAIAIIGKVRLDKNLKEIPVFGEETQSEFSALSKLF
jgi:polynucleotide 5'-hydroxyl-kinase GRC3/NOL9